MKYTSEDFRHSTPPRIIGTETEYTTIANVKPLVAYVAKSGVEPYLFEEDLNDGRCIWLNNGGSLHADLGTLEIATPECTSAHEAALYERAGEDIAYDVAHAYASTKKDTQLSGPLVQKRSAWAKVYDSQGKKLLTKERTGHHENYYTHELAQRSPRSPEQAQALCSHLATRGIWTGAGIVGMESYGITQRQAFTDFSKAHDDTSSSAPIIQQGYPDFRLEIRSGEGNMSNWQVVQKLAFTSLVLRLIEHDQFPDEFLLPQTTLKAARRNTSPQQAVALHSGEMVTAAAYQRQLAQRALDFADTQPEIPREETDAAQAIIRVCKLIDALDTSDPDLSDQLGPLSGIIDWAAKLQRILGRGIPYAEIHTRNLAAVAEDLRWNVVEPYSISRRHYRYQPENITFDQHQLARARAVPPQSRAKKRVAILKKAIENGTFIDYVYWDNVEFIRDGSFDLDDPFEAS